jgi:FtsK/SpoIIIE family
MPCNFTAPEASLITLGHLPKANAPACIPCDPPVSFVLTHDVAGMSLADNLAEGIALQFLDRYTAPSSPISATCDIIATAPTPAYAVLKGLLARTEQRLGSVHHERRALAERFDELLALAHQRDSLLAAAHLPDWATYAQRIPGAGPWHFLLITDLIELATHLDNLWRSVLHLCQHGPRVGLVPVVLHSPDRAASLPSHTRETLLPTFQQAIAHAIRFSVQGAKLDAAAQFPEYWRLFQQFGFRPGLPADHLRDLSLSIQSHLQSQSATSTLPEDALSVVIGQQGATPVHFRLGPRTACYHALIGGGTGSGKSSFLKNLILSACESASPDALRLVLVDMGGTEFDLFSTLPHVELCHCGPDTPRPALIFRAILEEVERRKLLFSQCRKAHAREVASIHDYRRVSGQPLPAHVIIIDEFQKLLTEPALTSERDDRTKPALFLADIAKEGRKFGLHLILSTQTYENVPVSSGDRDNNYGLRLALRLNNHTDCRYLMGADNDEATTLPIGSFQAILNEGGGKRDRNQRFTLATWDGGLVDARIAALQGRYTASSFPHYLELPDDIEAPLHSLPKRATTIPASEFPDPSTL